MALVHRFGQRIGNPRTNPDHRRLFDAELHRNGVSGLETDAADVTRQPVRVLGHDIRGIGFKTADAIAMKLGIEKTAMIRVRAGISYALTEAMDEEHCGLPTMSWCRLPRSCSRSRGTWSAPRSISN